MKAHRLRAAKAHSRPGLIALSADGNRGGKLAPCPAEQPLHRVTLCPHRLAWPWAGHSHPPPLHKIPTPPFFPTEGKGGAGSKGNKLAHHVFLIWITLNTGYVHKHSFTLAQSISPWHRSHSPRCSLQISKQSVHFTTGHILAFLFTQNRHGKQILAIGYKSVECIKYKMGALMCVLNIHLSFSDISFSQHCVFICVILQFLFMFLIRVVSSANAHFSSAPLCGFVLCPSGWSLNWYFYWSLACERQQSLQTDSYFSAVDSSCSVRLSASINLSL